MKVKAECRACGATGLYKGFAEPQGTAVVCLECDGTGCKEIQFEPFTSRKPRSDIRYVRLSKGGIVLSCGPTGSQVTYEDFCRGVMPERR